MQEVDAYIGLGSNLQEPQLQIKNALQELREIPNTHVLESSSLYKSKPMGPVDQPNFINAVAKISTFLNPEELLTALQNIEKHHQRERVSLERWGPRTLDLDIILYGNQQIHTNKLQIPHSGMTKREFVLIPLQELEADLIIPGKGALGKLIEQLPHYQLTKIETINVESQS